MKILVATTGDFQLVHSEQQELVRASGFSCIEKSQWANGWIGSGQVIVKAQVNDEASDAEWLETLRESDGDVELAVASFTDRFPVDEESANKPEAPPKPATTKQVQHNASTLHTKGRKAGTAGPKQE